MTSPWIVCWRCGCMNPTHEADCVRCGVTLSPLPSKMPDPSTPSPVDLIMAMLRTMAATRTTIPEGYAYTGPADYLLRHGRSYEPAPLPADIDPGIPQQCFFNAASLARQRRGLTYVEGYAFAIIPVEHAWCVDAAGRVVDPTWIDLPGRAYFGVPVDLAIQRACMRRRPVHRSSTSVLFDWQGRYPLLRAGGAR